MDPTISENFYRAVVQSVLIFGSEIWVLMEAIMQNIEGVCVGFPRQVTGEKAQRIRFETSPRGGGKQYDAGDGNKTSYGLH